ncbi:ethanolamine ammonia-lyase subunit EutC [Paludibacterium purpuratum]|uniref:Ethanolamine ammonia-lyase small subunit n=1 Tax=Paludibacterium purpuratum TaxID=1144873 RepID=A0A4R7B1A1_9NEIS|nr:ethanolamine ammonia-lyase subunit EutC [Paludibacterium purpuratum]TDR76702.1 ethanolamine ammonia-lyase light chain [Paludibacterium purpuratum]
MSMDDRQRQWLQSDPWAHLASTTPARIALGRCGVSVPTGETLRFALAHAQARDAVHAPMAVDDIAQALRAQGFDSIRVQSQAVSRDVYLQRPDLGRRLDADSLARLQASASEPDELVFAVGDGLSALAVDRHAVPLLALARPLLEAQGWRIGPVVLASLARVALGDEIGAALKARAVVVLIGERPGLSSPDSMGLYLTYAPRPGRRDAERNCISNVRPAGLALPLAARKLAWMLDRARELGCSGVALKDESDAILPASPGMLADI